MAELAMDDSRGVCVWLTTTVQQQLDLLPLVDCYLCGKKNARAYRPLTATIPMCTACNIIFRNLYAAGAEIDIAACGLQHKWVSSML
jgi:hypothetical protein